MTTPRPPSAAAAGLAVALGLLGGPAAAHDPGDPPPAALPAPPAVRSAPPVTLDVAVHIGPTVRLGEGQYFDVTGRAGVALGAGAFLGLTPHLSFGLGYEHTTLGSERGALPDGGTVDVTRGLDAVWATVRAYPFRNATGGFFVELGPGVAWQHAQASGLLQGDLGAAPTTFGCKASDSADFGLRAGLGGEVSLGSNLWLVGSAGFDNVRLSTEVLERCIPGAGTLSLFALRAAFAYRFDVTRGVR